MFFIKAAFWLTLVVALIPVNPADLKDGQRNVSAMETFGIAQSMFKDVSQFCSRNQASCEKGAVILSQMGLKAREGARIVYTYLDGQVEAQADQIQVGSVSK